MPAVDNRTPGARTRPSRTRFCLLLAFPAVMAMAPGSPLAAQEEHAHTSDAGIEYLVTPPQMNDGGGPPPLLLFLHGGDRSNTRHHPARYAAQEGLERFPFLVVAPHCAAGCSWPSVDFAALLDEVEADYAFDRARVYLTGYSMGGFGAWDLLIREPSLFAAAAPIAGGGDADEICTAATVPIRAYHGDRDNVIPHSASVEMVEALDACGGRGELITLSGVDHGSWVPTFKDPAFYAWLLEHRRSEG